MIASCIEASTLDTERNHYLDKRAEQRRCVSVAKASRDSMLRQWRTEVHKRNAQGGTTRQRVKSRQRANHCNVHGMALKRRPDLFPQAQGKLWWQGEDQRASSKVLRTDDKSQEDNREELKRFIDENRQSLEAELQKTSAQEASAMPEHSPTTWPASRPEWVAWLQNHRERFDGTMRRVRLGCRNEVNCRLCSPGALPAVSRLQPMRRSVVGKLPWAPRIFDGFLYVVVIL